MTPTVRFAALSAAALTLGGCGMVEGDPQRFEGMARRIAAIPVTMERGADAPISAADVGLRPAQFQPLQVQVMDPHELWDARDAGLRGAVVQAAAPAVADAVVQHVRAEVSQVAPAALRPAVAAADTVRRTTIQLGAFSTEAAARAAWAEVSGGPARRALSGLTPAFEPVRVNGRPFTRLKVGPIPVDAAAAVCRAADIADPWCRKAG